MKLIDIIHQTNYTFTLFFENGEKKDCDLKELIEKHVSLNQIKTAQINPEWGCLEFNEGRVDIEPKTLYNYAYDIKKLSEAA
ncbi:MAG: DUF2442 domain-containing protein [Methylococcaceae bacterium]|nr:DUF2442 domain-containing protein [Methylococcaceae bacterium]